MTELVRRCCDDWHDGKCVLGSSVKGWGCRLLTCTPDSVPCTLHDKARLFARVYDYAQKVGVLGCPHYNESVIDATLDDNDELTKMVLLNHPVQTDLLSDYLQQV